MSQVPTPEMVATYSGRAPRYTSYPPVPHWSDAVGPEQYAAALHRAGRRHAPLSMYVHLPFCVERCWYCGCNVTIQPDRTRVMPYLERLQDELAAVSRHLDSNRPITHIHFGGGTPNYLDVLQFGTVLDLIRDHFPLSPRVNIAAELDPRVATPSQVAGFARLGVNRMSFGVQDLNAEVGAAIGRQMSVDHLATIVRAARDAGVRGINFDLMYGLPKQTCDSLRTTLDQCLTLKPDRFAVYGYAHVPWMRPQQRRLERAGLPEPNDRVRLFATVMTRFAEAGLEPVGLDHFARPGDPLVEARRSGTFDRSFQGYTPKPAGDLLAFGSSAIGRLNEPDRSVFIQNEAIEKRYRRIDGLATVRGYISTADDLAIEALIKDVLCRLEVRRPGLWSTHRAAFDALESFERDGLVRRVPAGLQVEPLGRYFLRQIASCFDPRMNHQAVDTSNSRYSAAV